MFSDLFGVIDIKLVQKWLRWFVKHPIDCGLSLDQDLTTASHETHYEHPCHREFHLVIGMRKEINSRRGIPPMTENRVPDPMRERGRQRTCTERAYILTDERKVTGRSDTKTTAIPSGRDRRKRAGERGGWEGTERVEEGEGIGPRTKKEGHRRPTS